jgi:phenylpropionate dioxygenase-like ring-hydroxylating dioxygenase large terminal subunit
MSEAVNSDYVIGEYAAPSQGRGTAQERKSQPLSTFLPERDRYLRLSVDRYYDPAHMDLEWDRLWTHTWICAGRVSDLPEKGSWFRFDFGRESFIVVRSDENEINAIYNVCQHRANRLIDDDFGTAAAFVCPYHSWRYDRSGRCTRVTDRELFKQEALSGSLDLPRIRCESFAGFVFINMDDDAPPLMDHLGELTDVIAGYGLDNMEIRNDVVLELDCNWKTVLDAFSENYHVHITHSFALPIAEDKVGQMDFYPGGHTRRIVALGDPALRRGNVNALHPMQRMLLETVGIDPDQFEGGPRSVRRAVQEAKRAMGAPLSQIYDRLSDNQLTDNWALNLFPNMHIDLHAEGALSLRYFPHRSDPERCTLHIMVLAHPGLPFTFYLPDATEFEDNGRPKRLRIRHDDPNIREEIGQLLSEDIRNTRETQRGFQSRGFKKMRLSEHEQPIMYQHATMDSYLDGERENQEAISLDR